MSDSADPAHPFSACTPISPSCLDPRVPIHTTPQETASRGSSAGITSTVCPRLSLLKFPRSLKPFGELSTIRQGNLSVCPLTVATMLARLVRTTRSERRLSGARKGTAFAPVLRFQAAILPEDRKTNNQEIAAFGGVRLRLLLRWIRGHSKIGCPLESLAQLRLNHGQRMRPVG